MRVGGQIPGEHSLRGKACDWKQGEGREESLVREGLEKLKFVVLESVCENNALSAAR